MRRLVPLVALVALACEPRELPPGEVIGTFAFEATLEDESPESCRIDGAPQSLSFEGVLAHDRATGEAWMQIGGTIRVGTLDGASFELGLEPHPDGSARAIPRRLDACTCDLLLVETIEGKLVRNAAECETDEGGSPPTKEPGPTTCPRVDEEGALFWDTCGAICGSVREQVRFTTEDCTCEDAGVPARAPQEGCTFFYAMQGLRIGG